MNGYQQLIDQYEAGAPALAQAVEGLSQEDLLAFPIPGTWSIQQIVIHLMDSDLVLADRMKRVIAEDNPLLVGFKESRFAQDLFYELQPAGEAVRLFELNRRLMAVVLRQLPELAFHRIGTHNERGQMKLLDLLDGAVRHLEHHLAFLFAKRAKLGKPITSIK